MADCVVFAFQCDFGGAIFFCCSQSTIGDVAAVAGAVVFSSVCFHNICISKFLRCYYVSFIVWSWLALLV